MSVPVTSSTDEHSFVNVDKYSHTSLPQLYVLPGGRDAKVFLHKSLIGRETLEQILQLAANSTIAHARFMPDCHFAHGCCVGMTSHLGLSICILVRVKQATGWLHSSQ